MGPLHFSELYFNIENKGMINHARYPDKTNREDKPITLQLDTMATLALKPRRYAELGCFVGLILLVLLAGCGLQPV
jgi:hypothetical protein